MMKQQDNKQALGGVTIKTEPGTSASPAMQRLPSLRPPRDLSLSAYSQKIPNLNPAKNKKVYVPNLNVQRNKPAETVTVKTEPSVKPELSGRAERTRGRAKRTLIQLNAGLFADGVPGQRSAGRGRGGGGERADTTIRKPTLKLKENIKVDKEEEENTMKQLLKDDFIDDPTLEPDFDKCPVTLPLLNIKQESGLKNKCDWKPIDKKENLTINDVFCDESKPSPGFIMFQLPTSMPGLRVDPPSDSSKGASSSAAADSKPEGERCLLSTLPGGCIGKLQILKSGRARLVFGNTKMWVEMGTQVAFRQDLVSVNLNKESLTGDMVNLGTLNMRMVATPDWEAMMADASAEKKPQTV